MTWEKKWQVPSSSSNDTYVVGLSDSGEYACSCKGWTMHTPRRPCKHIIQVTSGITLERYAEAGKIMDRMNQKDQDLTRRPGRLIDLPD